MYIVLDMGGTNTRVASFDQTESPTKVESKKFPTNHSYFNGVRELIQIVRELAGTEQIEGIGVSVALPLTVNEETAFTVNLSSYGWGAKKLKRELAAAFQTNVRIINDASAGALGETIFGNHKFTEFIFLTWGTGVGGVYLDRQGGNIDIYEFEPGHIEIVKNGRSCVCGKKGCLQAYTGGRAIEGFYKKEVSKLKKKEWEEVLSYMKIGINKILLKYPSSQIVINGTVVIKNQEFINKLRAAVNDKRPSWTNIEKSYIGDEGPLYGALMSLAGYLDLTIHKKL